MPGVAREFPVRVYRQMFLGGLVVTWNQQDISRLLTLFQQGRFDPVIKTVLPLLKKQRKVPGLHDLAGAAFAAKGDVARAERHLVEALRLAPNLESALHNLANLYFQTGRFEKAATRFRAFLKRRPGVCPNGEMDS